jgi:hypothetical protein
MRQLAAGRWDPERLRVSAERFSEGSFRSRLLRLLREHGAH